VTQEIDHTSGASRSQSGSGIHVEVKVNERGAEILAASDDEVRSMKVAQGRFIRLLVLAVIWLVAAIYVGMHIGKGWVPADDGTLSQSALRVMQGQLPNRDFGEIYTGGLSFIHAAAFRAFGVNLMSLRICVFLFFLAWVPAVYYILLRFASATAAGAITLVAVAWSYPNYPAAMPSWYNLFFATFGAAALLRYLEVRTRRWLFAAGVCGGISILIKVIGAYYIAGALLFLAFLEQSEGSREETESKGLKSSWPYRVFSVAALLLFLSTLIMVLKARLGMAELYQFVLPSTAVVGLILLGERNVVASAAQRFRTMSRLAIPFLCGLASPIVVFLLPYARSHSIATFVGGVTSSAVARSAGLGVVRPLGIDKLIYVLPLVGVLAAAMYWDKFQGKAVGAALGLAGIVLVFRATRSFDVLYGIWCSIVVLTPAVVLLGVALLLARRNRDQRSSLERRQVALLISLAATCSLVQFPFAAAIYLCYAIPLTLLAAVAIVCTGKKERGTYPIAAVIAFYLAFAVVSLVPHYIYEITWVLGRMYPMQTPRAGGLQIEEAVFFDDLARFLHDHSPNGLMFAGNDCPELYFLSGLKNVTFDDTGAGPETILKAIKSDDLKLVVINDAPFFPGGAMPPIVKAEVAKRFPHNRRFGIFDVFWRD